MSTGDGRQSPYYAAYGYHVHQLMLLDEVRTAAYRDAIFKSKDLFIDKVVMDIGAGTGILSLFCAQAGAKKVYAVEAAPHMVDIIKECAADNDFSDVITVIEGEVENLAKLINLEPGTIDVIISEWMGFFLLHEGMLDSILSARKYLKEDGFMFPDKCVIQAALCELPDYHNWEDFFGLNLSSFGRELRASSQTEPQICLVKESHVISKPVDLFSFDVKNMSEDMTQLLRGKFVVPASRDGQYQGLCIWFNVTFPSSSEEKIVLSTSPFSPGTHWKQTVIVFDEVLVLEEQEPVAFEIMFEKNGPRTYRIHFTHDDADTVPHPEPCDCYHTKCIVFKMADQAYSQQADMDIVDITVDNNEDAVESNEVDIENNEVTAENNEVDAENNEDNVENTEDLE